MKPIQKSHLEKAACSHAEKVDGICFKILIPRSQPPGDRRETWGVEIN